MKNPARRYLVLVAIATGLPLVGVVGFNATMDPSWSVSFPNELNLYQKSFDERRQKVAYLSYRAGSELYRSVLVGSSRATFIPVDAFPDEALFNFGLSSLNPDECASVIRYFKSRQGSPERVYLLMDFFGTQKDPERRVAHFDEIVELVEEPFYRPKILLSADTLNDSKDVWRLRFVRGYREGRRDYYSGPGEKHLRRVDDIERQSIAARRKEAFLERYFPENYSYRRDYMTMLKDMREAAAPAEVVVLTAPISSELFVTVMERGHFDDYGRWLGELVTCFGRVFDSMGFTELTSKAGAYHDLDHFYPEQAYPWLQEALERRGGGYGAWVDAGNLDSHLESQRDLVLKHLR